jgi:hypothetical protein
MSQTMRRLREISRFECDVRVLRNGFCKCVLLSSMARADSCEGVPHYLVILCLEMSMKFRILHFRRYLVTASSCPVIVS